MPPKNTVRDLVRRILREELIKKLTEADDPNRPEGEDHAEPTQPTDPPGTGDASEQAKQLGLHSTGWGRWADESGKTVAKTIDGTLVKIDGDAEEEQRHKDAGAEEQEMANNNPHPNMERWPTTTPTSGNFGRATWRKEHPTTEPTSAPTPKQPESPPAWMPPADAFTKATEGVINPAYIAKAKSYLQDANGSIDDALDTALANIKKLDRYLFSKRSKGEKIPASVSVESSNHINAAKILKKLQEEEDAHLGKTGDEEKEMRSNSPTPNPEF